MTIVSRTNPVDTRCKKPAHPCPQLPGTILRIFIPAGAVINLLNLIEVTSPSGICLIIRLPLLGGTGFNLGGLFNTIQQAGGSVEVMKN
ncbi:hypothetical protein [Alkaliphilus transvaalensis]|uniref:hypothetical protein n=1 Tax=Alkaliphilus transvaalensis TaxID=114628 RepID=UPI0005578DB0|nr:hypothetical protein [Alkaliphilus transvaalensis]